nr:alpha/beta hydrolase family protein [Cyanobium sp. Copco_Reservoir_LC18]
MALGNPAAATAAAATTTTPYRCDGDLLLATADNGAVDAPGIPNTVAGTVPGATVLLEWRGLRLQLPRTNNAGPPSYTDGIWWWSLEDPAQPRFLRRRGAIESFSCRAGPAAGPPADGR